MKLIVISSPVNINHEIETIIAFFELGLKYFHLRKPNFNYQEYKQFLALIPKQYKKYIIIHHHHQLIKEEKINGIHHTSKTEFDSSLSKNIHQSKSFHSLAEIENNNYPYNYVFLSPIFNSISKQGYQSKFDLIDIENYFKNKPNKLEIIALGGIESKNAAKAIEIGFDGVAILGAIWQEPDFKKRLEICQTILTNIR